MLFNKRIQQKYLNVELWNEEDLKILRLFMTKIKLKIENIRGNYIFTKEDFELIKPLNVDIYVNECFDISILPSNLESLTLSFSEYSPTLLDSK